MRGLSIMMRAPRRVLLYRIETCHFLEKLKIAECSAPSVPPNMKAVSNQENSP